MATAGKVDYHIHYFLDGCVNNEMILPGIVERAHSINLEEICILKHYSKELPNKGDAWVHWKRVIPSQFLEFLEDACHFRSSTGVRILTGVETELVNDKGKINIAGDDMDKVDIVSLSVHWMPDMKVISFDPQLYPWDIGKNSPEVASKWRRDIHNVGIDAIIENFTLAYVEAIKENPNVRILAHMYDGLLPLRAFKIITEIIDENKLLEIMEPLFRICAEKEVLWELSHGPAEKKVLRELFHGPVECEYVLKRANELGVCFSATTDAHCLEDIDRHNYIESYIDSLGLTKGVVSL